jgi:hypothetical protein
MSDDDTDDDSDDGGIGDIDVEPDTESEYVSCEKHEVIAPHGWGWAADCLGATLIRVEYKTGNVECLDNDSGKWRSPTSREVVDIKPVTH